MLRMVADSRLSWKPIVLVMEDGDRDFWKELFTQFQAQFFHFFLWSIPSYFWKIKFFKFEDFKWDFKDSSLHLLPKFLFFFWWNIYILVKSKASILIIFIHCRMSPPLTSLFLNLFPLLYLHWHVDFLFPPDESVKIERMSMSPEKKMPYFLVKSRKSISLSQHWKQLGELT